MITNNKLLMNKQNIGKNQLLNNVSYNINMNENLKKTKENHQNKKLESINKLSNKYDINKLKNLILGAESSVTNNGRETVNLYDNLKCEYDEKDKKFQYKLNEYWLKRTNEPYKNIIKDKQYYEKFLQKEKLQLIDPNELIIHKTGESDKKGFDDECEKYTKGIELHNNEIKTIYSMTNELEHKKKFEYESLYLIGSVIKEKRFGYHSDIDFVVKGLRQELFFKALAFLIKNSGFNIDLKPWEELDRDSRARVEREGRML